MNKITNSKVVQGTSIILVILLMVGGYAAYRFIGLQKENSLQVKSLQELRSTITQLEESLFVVEGEKTMLEEALVNEKNRNDDFEKQIKKISSTVGTLEKLSKTDPELLQKYSKVYFLNEHYIPSELSLVPKEFLYPADRSHEIHAKVLPHLVDLLEEAQEEGVEMKIASAYRSFDTQAALKSNYKITYGAGTANTFSADQGYSEHQLGTSIDLTTPNTGSNFNAFGTSEAYTWLQENAHKFGFILSYPKTNQYYQFEPWHWRFVGTELARDLHRENKFFYDIDQREIDKYLVNLFD